MRRGHRTRNLRAPTRSFSVRLSVEQLTSDALTIQREFRANDALPGGAGSNTSLERTRGEYNAKALLP